MTATPSRWIAPAAGALSGFLLALAFPPFGFAVLLPLAPVPWIVALVREENRGRALLSGALFGMAFWCVSVSWVSYVVTVYGGQPPAMGIVCVALLALILAEWPAAVAWGVVACAPAGSLRRLAAFPLLWLAAEHVRSVAYGGFPWNLSGWALARRPVWIQTASVWGVFGVGFAAAAVSALLAAAVLFRRAAFLGWAAAVVLAAGVYGAVRLSPPEVSSPASGTALRVALIQPNLAEEQRRTPEEIVAGYTAVFVRAREAVRLGTDLLVFPESTFPGYWERSSRLRDDLSRLARDCRCAVLFNDVVEEKDGRFANAARIVTPEGLAEGVYRKVHLVPFGEYVPLPRLFFFARQISQEIGEFAAASEPIVLRSGKVALGIGICYEIIYPSLARKQAEDGANLLATISNDSWYGRAGAQEQHFAGALFRAVENDRYLVRAAITGISGIVDRRGRIVAELPVNRPGTLRGDVPLLGGRTAWTSWGHWFPPLADVGGAAVLVFGFVRWRRERAARTAPPPSAARRRTP